MIPISNYFKVLKDYWHTPKGRHDILDYAYAICLILAISIILSLVLAYFL